jgi:hypothetical protein
MKYLAFWRNFNHEVNFEGLHLPEVRKISRHIFTFDSNFSRYVTNIRIFVLFWPLPILIYVMF